MSRVILGARCRVHTLLGSKIIYLSLTSFGFAALAGLGGGIVFDNLNRERKWKRFGWWLLVLCLPLGALTRILSLS